MRQLLLALALCVAAPVLASAQTEPYDLLRQPTVSRTEIAFSYAGDVWIVGRDGGDARRLTANPGTESQPLFSPDGAWIAFTDKLMNLWYVDVAAGKPVKVDTDRFETPFRTINPAWSPDGRWLAYTKQLPNNLRAVFVHSLAQNRSHQVTDGAGARDVTVVPVESEQGLRSLAWIEDNRRRVDELSGGRVAYVHLPNTAGEGYTNFNRYYFAQVGKAAAVVDERFNGGGLLADYVVDLLRRPPMSRIAGRKGRDAQLERAVEVVMEALRRNPPPTFKRPPYPKYQ